MSTPSPVQTFTIGDIHLSKVLDSLLPTPGHTPGHCSVQLKSNGQEAVITGDMIVNPVQIAEPEWSQQADADREQAIATRTLFVNRYCDTPTLILGTHFNVSSM